MQKKKQKQKFKKNRLIPLVLAMMLVAAGYRNVIKPVEMFNSSVISDALKEGNPISLFHQIDPDTDISLDNIPDYSGKLVVNIDGGKADFTEEEITDKEYINLTSLDSLGRCGAAMACLGPELLPTEEREDISGIYPSGWQKGENNNDDTISTDRSHLLAFCLTGLNAEEKNLITGTHQLNVDGMEPYELDVRDYIIESGNHVMYKVIPVFENDNLMASGVEMMAWSVEDNGKGINFHIFIYNVQDGYTIDYSSGKSWIS